MWLSPFAPCSAHFIMEKTTIPKAPSGSRAMPALCAPLPPPPPQLRPHVCVWSPPRGPSSPCCPCSCSPRLSPRAPQPCAFTAPPPSSASSPDLLLLHSPSGCSAPGAPSLLASPPQPLPPPPLSLLFVPFSLCLSSPRGSCSPSAAPALGLPAGRGQHRRGCRGGVVTFLARPRPSLGTPCGLPPGADLPLPGPRVWPPLQHPGLVLPVQADGPARQQGGQHGGPRADGHAPGTGAGPGQEAGPGARGGAPRGRRPHRPARVGAVARVQAPVLHAQRRELPLPG